MNDLAYLLLTSPWHMLLQWCGNTLKEKQRKIPSCFNHLIRCIFSAAGNSHKKNSRGKLCLCVYVCIFYLSYSWATEQTFYSGEHCISATEHHSCLCARLDVNSDLTGRIRNGMEMFKAESELVSERKDVRGFFLFLFLTTYLDLFQSVLKLRVQLTAERKHF